MPSTLVKFEDFATVYKTFYSNFVLGKRFQALKIVVFLLSC